ncbi:MAG: hypothetical protein K5644_07995 [Lachnospiraceae bacterium]|nr:hypothetical protein [Lachnospiraceae bacterium]
MLFRVEMSEKAESQYDKHKYLLIYRIVNDVVIVEGMYHELQDYENSF